MDTVTIINQDRDESGWTFVLDVTGSEFADDEHTITARLDDDTLESLSGGNDIYPDDLILHMFELIIAQQPKESLPSAVDVDDLLSQLSWLKSSVSKAIEDGTLIP